MKKIIFTMIVFLISTYTFSQSESEKKINNNNFALKFGYTSIDISHNILGNETVNTVEYIATYDFNEWGVWAKYENQGIKKLESNQYALGGQYTFYKGKNFYTLLAFGIGMADLYYKHKRYKTEADYIYYPLNFELGYMFHPNIGLYTTWGYKWFKNKNAKMHYRDIKILDEKSHEFDLDGQTYSVGIRIAF